VIAGHRFVIAGHHRERIRSRGTSGLSNRENCREAPGEGNERWTNLMEIRVIH
jgi:hypothetical protein